MFLKTDWVQKHIIDLDDYPRPNWVAITEYVNEEYADTVKHELWCDIARIWLDKLKKKLSIEYAVHELDNFILLTSEKEKYVNHFLRFLEKSRNKILTTLPGITRDDGYGKHVVIVFDDIDSYFTYISYFYPEEGTFGISSGIYLNEGYGHFAFPHQEITYAESIAAHEMTHALLSHLPIPLWLNEGIAVNIEDYIVGASPFRLDKEMVNRHRKFWGKNEVQEFWSGKSFGRVDEGQELSYHLAQFAVNTLSQNYDVFVQYVNKAHHSNGGEIAANEIFEGSLGGLLINILGDDDWSPKPNTWSDKLTQGS